MKHVHTVFLQVIGNIAVARVAMHADVDTEGVFVLQRNFCHVCPITLFFYV